MKLSHTLLLSCAALALTACASKKEALPPCPQVAIIRALETFNDHGSDTAVPENLVAVAKMDDVTGACQYGEKGVDLDFTVSMRALKGKRLGGNNVSMPFFVSVVNDHNKVVSKEYMTASFKFKDTPVASFQEKIHVNLPYKGEGKLTGKRVLLGFQLTQEQRLKQIRAQKKKLQKKMKAK